MPAKHSGFKTITFKEEVARRYNLTAAKLSYQLVLAAEEKQHLRNLAEKITKWPETVRIYTNPFMEKESGE
jgi:hypothetical protein